MVFFSIRRQLVFSLIVVPFIIISLNKSVFSEKLYVPGDYPSIPDAVTAAQNGDEIIVTEPTTLSTSNFGFGGKALSLINESMDPTTCIIQGDNASNSTVYMQAGSYVGSKIVGFTIISHSQFFGNGGAMSIHTTITVENCIISGSHAKYGGGVNISNGSKPVFINCIFSGNKARRGGAVYVKEDANPLFKNCLFKNNGTENGALFEGEDGDVFYLEASPARLVNCTIPSSNEHDESLIRQTGSNLPMSISNCIIDAGASNQKAIDAAGDSNTTHKPAIENTYINGTYTYEDGAVSTVYEPGRVLLYDLPGYSAGFVVEGPDPVYDTSYAGRDEYTVNGQFVPNFLETNMYTLNINSSCINVGVNSATNDHEYQIRPYKLKSRPDIGWDEFNFGSLIDNNRFQNTYWFNYSLNETTLQMNPNGLQAISNIFQTGKVLYYAVTPTKSGVLELWTDTSNVDLLGILFSDKEGQDVLMTDGKNGTWLNFHINYNYALANTTYYLAVLNQGDSAGHFNVYGRVNVDDYPNSCIAADNATETTFTTTYFSGGSTPEKLLPQSGIGQIDFTDDEDIFKVEFTNGSLIPGTLVITPGLDSEGNPLYETTPEYITVTVRNSDCEVVAEESGSGSTLLIYHNTTGAPCYVTVTGNPSNEASVSTRYVLKANYFPLDEADRTISLDGYLDGYITYPGDKDYFTFVVPPGQAGNITAYTTGCTAQSKIDIYNPLHEKIEDNGYFKGSDYWIEQAVTSSSNSVNFFVSSGTYYMRVSPYHDHTSPFPYTLHLTFASSAGDAQADNLELAEIVYPWKDSTLMTGDPELYYETKSSAINSSDDTDFFRIDVPYKSKLDIMVTNATGAIAAQLLDSRGNILVADTDIRTTNPACQTDGSTTGIYTDVEEGKYYIRLSAGGSTNYVLNIDLDDFPDTPSSSEALAAEWIYSRHMGHIETVTPSCGSTYYDKDIFRIQVPNNNQYRIYTTGNSNTAATLYQCTNETCSVSSPYTTGWSTYYAADYDGHNFAISLGDPESSPVSYDQYGIPLTAGTYAVEVRMQNPATDTGEYTIHIKQRDDYCNDNTCTTSPPVGSLTSVDGTLRTKTGVLEVPGDIDYFTCVPTANGRLVLKEPLGQKPDLIFKLMDATNDRLTYSSAGDLEFDVKRDVTYYVSVNPVYALNTGDYSFTYQLTNIGSNGDDDGEGGTSPGNNYAQARLLHPDNSVVTAEYSGSIDLAGDYDYYYFTITGAGALRIFSGGGTDTYGYLFLQEKNMYNLVMSDDDSGDGRNFEINYYINGLETDTHTYYLKVRGYSTTETGDYSLYIYFNNAIDVDDHGDECETATPVSLNTGSLEGSRIVYPNSHIGIPGDNDYFKVVAGPVRNLNNEDILIDPGMLTVYTSNATVDTFGYLKDQVCGTKALNDNGSDPADGQNFRLSYAPDCTAQTCTPKVYHVLARGYSGTEIGAYTFNVESNGSFIDPEGTTQIYIQGSGTHYAAFDAPAHVSYLNARATAGSITNMSLLDATIMDGNGAVLEMDYNDGEEDTVKPLKDIVMNTPIYVAGLERGLHFVKIDNQGATGTFNLTLNCSPYGSIGYGNASGTFGFNEDTMVFTVTAEGSGFTGASDNGFLVYHVLEAGFEFIAKVTFPTSGVTTGALGGFMVREDYETNEAQARYVFSGLSRTSTGYNAITRVRSSVQSSPTDPISVAAGNGYYVRLHYGGNGSPIVTNYSSNGKTWSADYIASVHLVPPLYVGYAVSSALDNSNLQVNYSNIQYVELELEEE